MSFSWGAPDTARIDPTVEPAPVPGVGGGYPCVPGADEGDIDNVLDTTGQAGAVGNPTVPVAN